MRLLKRLFQRLLVALLGVATVWLILVVFFDVADRKLPLVLALAATYGVAAYLVLPRVIRLGARILQRGRVPSYTLTGDGLPGDPVNVALIGTFGELQEAFRRAGWVRAAPLGLASSWKMAQAFVLDRPYPDAPFSTLFLLDRGQDVGFQRSIDDSPRKRHHVRFWGIPANEAEHTLNTPEFWRGSRRPGDGEPALWLGAVTKDTGLALTRLSFQITHATDGDTNAERDFLMDRLAEAGAIGPARSYKPGERVAIGKVNRYVTDGVIAVADILRPDA
ncbi:LssY C-terminal domain-containing protein [Alsobacter sp. SYSU M60028]|uniref:LssY C-terminal domain-containing protein n=1 Tax=Alsobacter ponti TaxID=2962936 RepID=A0ABT1L7J2_9HYPH|nr:LssY C-terminal domain-containing protein [Alsobacter ponti]MCP8937456.1 LssY C-terminal domain-containing protein [Alsobacter ponti]